MSNRTKGLLVITTLLVLLAWLGFSPGSDARKEAKEKEEGRRKNPVH